MSPALAAARQTLSFLVVGASSTGLYFLLLWLLRERVGSVLLLTGLCYGASMVYNYLLQSGLTFRAGPPTRRSVSRFVVMHLAAMALNSLLMAALESPKGILNAYEICSASDRMFGVAISGGDFRKCMQTKFDPSGIDMMVARGQMLIAARAAGIQCFDTVFTDLDDNEGFEAEVRQNKAMGFDGKSLINPKQIRLVHQIFAPTEKEVAQAEAMVSAFREAAAAGIGVFTVNGKMVDVAFIPGAERTLRLAKACGMYEGDLV